ncbi:NAD(P)/FAD-dependent oxidoreductase [Streptomyces sp. NPDC008001]|uniref:NAD(P)/FAD-dependent oxidoreductase n=1 Tax=Streptomyces sp. NPDC008001 TaxID=3364804 RepID=UPI0036E3A49A
MYDVVVIGAGPAGLSAAIMISRAGRSVCVVATKTRRNSTASSVQNVPYAHGTSPEVIYAKMERDALDCGVEFIWDEAVDASSFDSHVSVAIRSGQQVEGRRLLLAAGRVDDLPAWLPEGVWGRSAFDCPYCHAHERRGGRFAVVGVDGETLTKAALARVHASALTVVVSDAGTAKSPLADLLRREGAEVVHGTVRDAVVTDAGALRLTTDQGSAIDADTLLLGNIVRPNRKFVEALGLDDTESGFPETTLFGQTSDPLVFSAGNGDGSSPYYMWTGAASSGINAGRLICEDLAFRSALLESR